MIEFSQADLGTLMHEMAETAGVEVLPRFGNSAANHIRTKTGPDDLVTDADIAAERRLTKALGDQFPHAFIVGEEAVSKDPALLDRLAHEPLAIVIDPVDGTWNFAHGTPVFGMIVAVVSNGRTVAGAIHYPLLGDFLVARLGQGAWHFSAEGVRKQLALPASPGREAMRGFVQLHMFSKNEQLELAPRLMSFARTTTWGCSAFEYRLITTGAVEFSLNATLMPWDHAAGTLIYTEAGGHAALLSGEPYVPTLTRGRLLLASSARSWRQIASEVNGAKR